MNTQTGSGDLPAGYRLAALGELQPGDTIETGLSREGAKVIDVRPDGWVLVHWGFGSGLSYRPADLQVIAHCPSRADLFDRHCERMKALMREQSHQFSAQRSR